MFLSFMLRLIKFQVRGTKNKLFLHARSRPKKKRKLFTVATDKFLNRYLGRAGGNTVRSPLETAEIEKARMSLGVFW